jgi:hypothetical protein
MDALSGRALAVSFIRPAAAEPLWRDLLRKRSGPAPAAWQAARIEALIAAGAHDRAVTVLSLALAETPAAPQLLALVPRLGLERDSVTTAPCLVPARPPTDV